MGMNESGRGLCGQWRCILAFIIRLAGALQRHSQCVSELCELSQSPCSPAALVRLAQYYAGWAQLRDTLIPDWIPRGGVLLSDVL